LAQAHTPAFQISFYALLVGRFTRDSKDYRSAERVHNLQRKMTATEKIKVLSIKGIIMVSAVLAMFIGLCFGLGGLPVLGLTALLSYLGSRRSLNVYIAIFLHSLAQEDLKQQSLPDANELMQPDSAPNVKTGKKGRSKKK
jgi:hypothetical protein